MNQLPGTSAGTTVSIITPTLDRAEYLPGAIESVLQQDHALIEHIVVDGGSSDETLEILRSYRHLKWASEPDGGMYTAINKGIQMARGEIIGLLNSDDLYQTNVFAEVVSRFEQDPNLEAGVGGADVFYSLNGFRRVVRTSPAIEADQIWSRLGNGDPNTNAWFFRRTVFQRVGMFDESYRFAGDREFLLRIALAGVRIEPIRRILYHYRQHDGSVSFYSGGDHSPQRVQTRVAALEEGRRICERFLQKSDLPAQARLHIRRKHDKSVCSLVSSHLRRLKIWPATQLAWKGLRFNLLWPLVFAGFMIAKWRPVKSRLLVAGNLKVK